MVSNKKYKAVLKDKQLYEKWFRLENAETNRLVLSIASYKDEIKRLCDLNIELTNKADDYKQKYLDEQHKRLLLAEQVESLEAKVKEAESGAYI